MRLRHVLFSAVLLCAAAPFAAANQLLFEDFTYPIGALDGQSGGIGWAGSWVAPSVYVVAPGSLLYAGLATSGNRAEFVPDNLAGTNALRTISTLGTPGSTFWLSFLMSYDGTIGQTTADVRLNDGAGGYLYIGRPLGDQSFWGVEDTVSPVTNSLSSVPIVAGVPVFIAVRIDLNPDPTLTDTVTVYFDPNPATGPSGAPGVPGLVFSDLNYSATNIPIALDGSAFPSPATSPVVVNYDPIRGGTTYFDVAPGVTPTDATVPEPASFVLLGLGVIGVGVSRRRRRD